MNINYTSLLNEMIPITSKPLHLAGAQLEENTVFGEISGRLLLVVQAVTSLVALPIILLIGLLEAALLAITCNRNNALTTLEMTLSGLTEHLVLSIPISLIAIFTPKSIYDPVGNTLDSCVKKINTLWNLDCCAASEDEYGYIDEQDDSYPRPAVSSRGEARQAAAYQYQESEAFPL